MSDVGDDAEGSGWKCVRVRPGGVRGIARGSVGSTLCSVHGWEEDDESRGGSKTREVGCVEREGVCTLCSEGEWDERLLRR